jgi:hypothetical protein
MIRALQEPARLLLVLVLDLLFEIQIEDENEDEDEKSPHPQPPADPAIPWRPTNRFNRLRNCARAMARGFCVSFWAVLAMSGTYAGAEPHHRKRHAPPTRDLHENAKHLTLLPDVVWFDDRQCPVPANRRH